MKKENEIVVFQTFDNSIDANIIKTKLDAFDIECFLTDENLSNLYPGVGTHMGAFRVKLYVFAKDIEEATRILEKNHLQIDDDSVTRCPKCGSRRVDRDFSKKVTNTVLNGLVMAIFAVFFPSRKVHHCLDCETEFN